MQWSGNADVQMGEMKAVGLSFDIPLPVSAWVCKFKNVFFFFNANLRGKWPVLFTRDK